MPDQELMKELRSLSAGPSAEMQRIGNKAADRIEELVKELSHGSFYKESTIDKLIDHAETAEANLAKAVEFIQEVRRNGDTRLASMAIAVLAKLEGDAL